MSQIDSHKLMYHPHEVSAWLKGENVAPIYVEIGPINSCNHKCVFCALDYLKSKGESIDKDVLISTLKNMADFGVKSIMFGGEGEPLAYPHISEAVIKANEFGLDIAFTTNGVFFDSEKIDNILDKISWIKFSIDAGTKETYAKVHGCREQDFEKVMENIKLACEYRKEHKLDTKIGSQMLMINDSIDEVEILTKKVKEMGADYLVLKPYSQHPNSINKHAIDVSKYGAKLRAIAKKYSDTDFKVVYRENAIKCVESDVGYICCHGINFFTLIDALGNVIPCNIFYEKDDFYYGNINENTFDEIWNSGQRKEVLGKLNEMGCKDCRKGCRLSLINTYLDNLKEKNVEHINFI